MTHPNITPPTPERRSHRALLLSVLVGVVVIALIIVLTVVWSAGSRETDHRPVALSASVDGEPIGLVPSEQSNAQARVLGDLGAPAYLALRPFAVEDAASQGLVSFELVLPTKLPDGAFVTFARYDAASEGWAPAVTTVAADSMTVTAALADAGAPAADGGGLAVETVSYSASSLAGALKSVWTVVVGGTGAAVDSIGQALQDVGADVTDIADAAGTWWNEATADWGADFALGSQWVMRASREVYGTGADAPECAPDADGAVPWITDTLLSDNAMIAGLGLEGGNAAVLLCVGPDPADASALQVRAAANRSYGFPVRFAEGIQPRSAGMDVLDISTSTLIEAGYSAIASGGDLILNPGRFILPGQTYTFSVDEDTVRGSQGLTASNRIVEYPLGTFSEVLLSGVLGVALAQLDPEDFFGGALGVFFLARDCDFTQWDAGTPWTELVNGASTCAGALDSDALQNAAADVARTASGESADRATALVAGGAGKARGLIGKLGWMTLFSLSQTVTDYIADIGTEELTTVPAWYVDVVLAAPPSARWEDITDTWCVSFASCTEIAPGTRATDYGSTTLTFERMMGDCFAGVGVDDPGTGANIVYCPAGAATPAEVPGSDPGLPPGDDDSAFDRVFVYQGYGTLAWFREAELSAVRGG